MELTVQSQVKHNGKWYKAGETIKDLSEADYNRLKELHTDKSSEGVKVSGLGTYELLDQSNAKFRNRSEFVEYRKNEDGTFTEIYK
jgi:hypothetical protein